MTRHSAILFLLFFALPYLSGAQERPPAEQLKSLIESCQFSQAASLAELFLARDSTGTELLLLNGRALAAMAKYREALGSLNRAMRTDSTDIRVLNELVQVYRQSGDLAGAIGAAGKMARLVPENSWFRLHLAGLYYAAEDYYRALPVLRSLYASDSTSFQVARQLGNCYNELRNNDSAVFFYRRALKLVPFDPHVTGKLANVYIRIDQAAMALYLTQKYLEQDSTAIPILKQQGYCLYLLIDFPGAASQFRRCTLLGDSSKFTLKYLGLAFYKQSLYDNAAPVFGEAFRCDTSDAEVCFYYGVSALRSGRSDTGRAYLERAMRLLMPSDKFLSTLYSELADANTATGRADTSVSLLKKALETNPANNTLRFKLAYQYDFHLRMPKEGLPWYRDYLKNEATRPGPSDPLQDEVRMAYGDYARNRVREISGTKTK